jgi:hypothetical protein
MYLRVLLGPGQAKLLSMSKLNTIKCVDQVKFRRRDRFNNFIGPDIISLSVLLLKPTVPLQALGQICCNSQHCRRGLAVNTG